MTEPVCAETRCAPSRSGRRSPLLLFFILPLALVLQACGRGGPEYVDAEHRLEQAEQMLRVFAIANEWHHSEHGAYTADASRFRESIEWPAYRDSVELRVVEMNDDGWAAVATHVALGDEIGCVFQWGATEATGTTPGGRPFSGGTQIECDEV